jgi:uncharacterized paraquat-inducible protein A
MPLRQIAYPPDRQRFTTGTILAIKQPWMERPTCGRTKEEAMQYRCPQCTTMLNVPKLFLSDVSACTRCGLRVSLGDFLAFFIAAISMLVTALSSLYMLTHGTGDPIVAGGYAVSIGMGTGIVVLVLLGRAVAFKSISHQHSQTMRMDH